MSDSPARPTNGTKGHAAARSNVIVPVLAVTGIVVALMQTLVLPIVPQLPHLLNASASDATWAVTATLLTAAVATPVSGRLGDMFGKRRMMLTSLAVMLAGSVIAALSDSLGPLIVGRALQGAASGVIPLGISIMRDELPKERLGSAAAMMSASMGVGAALGLPTAALIADNASWHALFWASTGLSALVILLVVLLVPESKVRTGGRFDLVGALGLSVALVSLLLVISQGADWGWTSGTTLGLFVTAVVVLLLWGRFELRTANPLVNLRVTTRRQVLLTNLASTAFSFSMYTMQLLVPRLMQLPAATGYGMGKSLLAVGLSMAPQGLVMMSMAGASAALSRAKGPKVTLMLGAATVSAAYALNILLMSQTWHLIMITCFIGAGVGLAYGAIPSLVMSAVPSSETGAANSLNTLMRSIGNSTSSAVAGVIFAHVTVSFGATAVPSENGFKTVMAIASCSALLSLTLAAFLPRRQQPAGTTATAPLATETAVFEPKA
ncbi:MFS transporter [Streptomyces sp. BV129]|uniref:MFS transporter n=1 Tax=Streptomyces sp. BV129 TaxID=2849671 RepID=UPI001C2E6EFE|nr:MFS transporter [Streptomyces sp. BV129]MBV1949072.1 MFS transporter [Streptomyces sp. BV129]